MHSCSLSDLPSLDEEVYPFVALVCVLYLTFFGALSGHNFLWLSNFFGNCQQFLWKLPVVLVPIRSVYCLRKANHWLLRKSGLLPHSLQFDGLSAWSKGEWKGKPCQFARFHLENLSKCMCIMGFPKGFSFSSQGKKKSTHNAGALPRVHAMVFSPADGILRRLMLGWQRDLL